MDNYKPLTDKDLEKGLFFVRHRILFKRILFGIAIFIISIIYIKFLFNLVQYFQSPGYYVLAQEIDYNQDWKSNHDSRAPIEPLVTNIKHLSIGNKKYNLAAFIENTNKDWAIKEFDYRFVVNGEILETQKAFINPGESRLLINLAYESKKPIEDLDIQTANWHWRRYNEDTKVVDWSLTDITFKPISNNLPAQAFWTTQNMSLFDLRKIVFQILLFNGSKLIAVNEIQSSDYMSLDKRNLDSVFWYSLPRVTETQIIPLFNWIDDSNYKFLKTDVSGGSRVEL